MHQKELDSLCMSMILKNLNNLKNNHHSPLNLSLNNKMMMILLFIMAINIKKMIPEKRKININLYKKLPSKNNKKNHASKSLKNRSSFSLLSKLMNMLIMLLICPKPNLLFKIRFSILSYISKILDRRRIFKIN